MYRALLIILVFSSCAFAADSSYYVNQGISFFEIKDYDAALVAFEEAEKISPGNLRITFNQACALWGSKKTDEAIEKFRKTAFAKDRNLAADSLYNIANIYVGRAVSYLAEPPENTPQTQRERSFAELEIAEKEFADCLLVDSTRTDARKSLESVRAWKSHIANVWANHDRNIKWNENSFAEYLTLLEKEQWTLRKQLQDELKEPNSPKKYQTFFLASKIQSRFADESSDLRKKIETTPLENLFPKSSKYTTSGNMEKIVREMIPQTEKFAQNASDSSVKLGEYSVDSALKSQGKAIEALDCIQTMRKNYEMQVRDAADLQETLVLQSRQTELDVPEHVWRQRFVERLAAAFLEKAKNEAEKIEADVLRNQKADDVVESDDDMFREIEKSDDELLLDSMKIALTLGPEIMELLRDIPLLYAENNLEDAGQIQEKVRVKLNRILEPLEEKTEQSRSQDPSEQKSNENERSDSRPDRQDGDTPKENTDSSDDPEQSEDGEPVESNETPEKNDGNETENSQQGESGNNSNENGTKTNPKQSVDTNATMNDVKTAEMLPLSEAEDNTEKLNAETLIRNVKRRHQEAEKIRAQLRRLTEPNSREPKDW